MVRPACILDDGGGEQARGATITSVVVSASRRRYLLYAVSPHSSDLRSYQAILLGNHHDAAIGREGAAGVDCSDLALVTAIENRSRHLAHV
jgi:hypothetical protein